MKLHCNGPADWPELTVDLWDGGRSAPNVERVAVALDHGFVAARCPRPILLYVARLFRDGYIPVPIEVVERSGNVAVFVYPNTSDELAAHYTAAKAALIEKGIHAVYVAPRPLGEPTMTANPFRPFDPTFLGPGDGPLPEGKLAMWWSTPQEPRMSEASVFREFERIYTRIDGIETYVFGALVNALGLTKGRQARVALPEEMTPVQITGPDLRQMAFSATAEKGIRFRFSVDTPVWYRDAFWRLFADYVSDVRARAESEAWPVDSVRRTAQWWELYKRWLPTVEAKGGESMFGILLPSRADAVEKPED